MREFGIPNNHHHNSDIIFVIGFSDFLCLMFGFLNLGFLEGFGPASRPARILILSFFFQNLSQEVVVVLRDNGF